MICCTCKADKHPDAFHFSRNTPTGRHAQCKACRVPGSRRTHLRAKFGLTEEAYDEILAAQGGGCAVCGGGPNGRWQRFHIDHDRSCCPGTRSCGKCIRGLVCLNCNIRIGWYEAVAGREDIAAYLAAPKEATRG